MAITAKSTGGSFDPAPAGMHHARCVSVIDLGTQLNDRYNKWQRKVFLTWELPNIKVDTEVDGEKVSKPAVCSKFYTLSLSEKAHLRRDLESWRGKPFTNDELAGFDIQNLLGQPALLQILHNTVGDTVYANVNNILPPTEKVPVQENELTTFSMEDDFDQAKFDSLSPGIQDMIKKSVEFEAKYGGTTKEAETGADELHPPAIDESDIPNF